jgi:hypothetical protein
METAISLLILLGVFNLYFCGILAIFYIKRDATLLIQRLPLLTSVLSICVVLNVNIFIILTHIPLPIALISWLIFLFPIPTFTLYLWRGYVIACRAEIKRNVGHLNSLPMISLSKGRQIMSLFLSCFTLSKEISDAILKLGVVNPMEAQVVGKRDLDAHKDYPIPMFRMIKAWLGMWTVGIAYVAVLHGLGLLEEPFFEFVTDNGSAVVLTHNLPSYVGAPLVFTFACLQLPLLYLIKLLRNIEEFGLLFREHVMMLVSNVLLLVSFVCILLLLPAPLTLFQGDPKDLNPSMRSESPIPKEQVDLTLGRLDTISTVGFKYIPFVLAASLLFSLHVAVPTLVIIFDSADREIRKAQREFSLDALDIVLHNPALYKDFKAMVHAQLCSENIIFYEQYKAMMDHANALGYSKNSKAALSFDKKLHQELVELHDMFVSTDASYALNITSDVRTNIETVILREKKCDPSVYEPVWKHVRYLLFSNTLSKFLENASNLKATTTPGKPTKGK